MNYAKKTIIKSPNYQINKLNLTVDIGNSSTKAALFNRGGLIEVMPVVGDRLSVTSYDKAILVSTRGEVPAIEQAMREQAWFFIRFDHTTPLPVENLYATPETLGADRLAAAVGAHTLYPDRTMLVVDFGTAITYDIVTAGGQYLGGNISPGAGSRFRALYDYTEALPLCELPGAHPSVKTDGNEANEFSSHRGLKPSNMEGRAGEVMGFPSKETRSAIENGVVAGIIAETEHYITVSQERYGASGVIFTGGDADYFARRVKFPIFAVSELVFQGLNAILEHNANL